MKLWFSLTLVCCALVCLILSFTRVVGLNHPWQVVGSGPWLDRGREPASDAPTVSVVTSIEFDSACAGPWQSLVLDGALTDRKSTRLNSSHLGISYAVFCLKKKT